MTLLATAGSTGLLGAILGAALTVMLGIIGVAWKLGSMSQELRNIKDRLDRMDETNKARNRRELPP